MATNNAINDTINDYETTALTIDPGASGDSYVQFDINTTGEFRIGVDDTDDSFRISQGSALGTNDTFVMTAAGERTLPLNPAFLAYNSSSDTNQTGNGAVATVDFDTEVYDQGGDFSADTFTAPIAGRYLLTTTVFMLNFTAADELVGNIVTDNRSYEFGNVNPTAVKTSGGNIQINTTTVADMDASDTATVTVEANGEAGNTNTILGSSATLTFFAGVLIS